MENLRQRSINSWKIIKTAASSGKIKFTIVKISFQAFHNNDKIMYKDIYNLGNLDL